MSAMIDKELLAKWEGRLGLSPTKTFRVTRNRILTSYKRMGHLAGYCVAHDTIYYSCKLDEWTIVHELLHKLHPNLAHRQVKKLTDETIELFAFHDSFES